MVKCNGQSTLQWSTLQWSKRQWSKRQWSKEFFPAQNELRGFLDELTAWCRCPGTGRRFGNHAWRGNQPGLPWRQACTQEAYTQEVYTQKAYTQKAGGHLTSCAERTAMTQRQPWVIDRRNCLPAHVSHTCNDFAQEAMRDFQGGWRCSR